jgi:hypothetical protein
VAQPRREAILLVLRAASDAGSIPPASMGTMLEVEFKNFAVATQFCGCLMFPPRPPTVLLPLRQHRRPDRRPHHPPGGRRHQQPRQLPCPLPIVELEARIANLRCF